MSERRDQPAPGDASDAALHAALQRFGHAAFSGPQREVVDHLLRGGDALLLLPTGGGKSLCYQLPALRLDGVTVVLSPLVALMQDQVDALRARGLPATFINSSLDREERERRLAAVVAGAVKLLYVTPERFRNERFVAEIAKVRVPLLAVDEAHCISAWGHDFRPEYGKVGEIRRRLGDPPTIALTATATPETQQDILARLRIPGARRFHGGIERANLFLAVREIHDEDEKLARIIEVASAARGPGIVYFALIQSLAEMRERLERAGLRPLAYHGDLGPAERRAVQRTFVASPDALLLATNAFGMGIDKPDIRFILHAQVPGSLEAWFQEIGRAGRDGKPGLCELLYRSDDVTIQQQFCEWSNPDAAFVRAVAGQLERWGDTLHARDLDDLKRALHVTSRADGRVETALGLLRAEGVVAGSFERQDLAIARPLAPGEERRIVAGGKRERDLGRLARMVAFARGEACRKQDVHAYFGIPWEGGTSCGSCDRCASVDAFVAAMAREGGATSERAETAETAATAPAGERATPVAPGDWIEVDGRYAVRVREVRRGPHGFVVRAESAGDFKVRTYDLARVTWKRM